MCDSPSPNRLHNPNHPQTSHPLLTELRILALHGLLHLLGYDHERGPADAEEMAAEEQRILKAMGWGAAVPQGLIAAAGGGMHSTALLRRRGDIKLVAIDLVRLWAGEGLLPRVCIGCCWCAMEGCMG